MAIRVGVIGIHGFARVHIEQFCALQAAGVCRVVAAVAHDRGLDEAYAARVADAGVSLLPDISALLATEVDLVTVPLGIHLHLPVTERCLAAGKAVYLEKPIAGRLAEVDRLIALERQAARPVIVGFQDLFQPGLWELKRRLLAGVIGRIRGITVTVGWPRAKAYYRRNSWAGRLTVGDAWVRDSIANNACAHFLNIALFLAGRTPAACAEPDAVDAELLRGYPIESFDTASITVLTAAGIRIRFNASHLGTREFGARIRIEGDAGAIINADLEREAPWRLPDGTPITVAPRHAVPYAHTVRFLAGEDVPVCRLAQGRAHAQVIEECHRVATIAELPGCQDDGERISHPRMDEALAHAHRFDVSLRQTGLL